MYHVVALKGVLDRDFAQRFVQVTHVRHLATDGVELLQRSTYVTAVLEKETISTV